MALTPEQNQALAGLLALLPPSGEPDSGSPGLPLAPAPQPPANRAGLKPQEQAALEALLALASPPGRAVDAHGPTAAPAAPDAWKTWLGLSQDDLQATLRAFLQRKDDLENRLRAWATANPFDAAFEFLAVCSYAFYLAEKDANPRISTYTDAFYYIGTCASVGYADIFAVTQAGKAIASLVMILGPSLAAGVFVPPSSSSEPTH